MDDLTADALIEYIVSSDATTPSEWRFPNEPGRVLLADELSEEIRKKDHAHKDGKWSFIDDTVYHLRPGATKPQQFALRRDL